MGGEKGGEERGGGDGREKERRGEEKTRMIIRNWSLIHTWKGVSLDKGGPWIKPLASA